MARKLTEFASYCFAFRCLPIMTTPSSFSCRYLSVATTTYRVWLWKPLKLSYGLFYEMHLVLLHFVILVSVIITVQDHARH